MPSNSGEERAANHPSLEDVLGNESPIILHDSQLEKRDRQARAQLRSVPFLVELGMGQFLYDDLWAEEFQLVEHEHRNPTENTHSEVTFSLAHLATSDQLLPRHEQVFEHEDISQANLTWNLFRKAAEGIADGHYIFVCDTANPHIPSRSPVPGRSAADQFNAVTYEYEELIQDYVGKYVDTRLPLDYTENLFFHRVSEHHSNHGAPCQTIPELFDYNNAPQNSPVWDPLYYFLEHELQTVLEEYEAHITTTLRSWVERGDTGKIARRMIATLHRCDFDVQELNNYRENPQR